MAAVWLGKSPLAELESDFASDWIFCSDDFSSLALETFRSPVTEFLRLVCAEQYAGLLLPHAANASAPTTASTTADLRMLRRSQLPGSRGKEARPHSAGGPAPPGR